MLIQEVNIPRQCEKCPPIAANLEALKHLEASGASKQHRQAIIAELTNLAIEDCQGAYMDVNRADEDFYYCGRNGTLEIN